MWNVPGSSPLARLTDDRLGTVQVFLKRDDLLDGEIPGNKWRKLKYQVADARDRGASTLLTFGGPYSNHVRAVAAAGRRFGFKTVGVIRGEERPFNTQLADAVRLGMTLHYIDRDGYRRKTEPETLDALREWFGDFLLIPEGGSGPLALRGCAELVAEIDRPFDLIACPVGTGGTLAGLALGAGERRALGFAVLRGVEYLEHEVARLQAEAIGRPLGNWSIDHRFHCGGFARRTAHLDHFIADFHERHGLLLDWVYVAKAMHGLYKAIQEGTITQGSVVVFVVTGPATTPKALPTPDPIPPS